MWKQDLKKVGMLTLGLGAAYYALYNSRQSASKPVEEEEAGKSRMLEEAKLRVEAAKEATVDKTKVIAVAAQDKVDGMKEHKTVAEDDAGKKLEAAKEELKEMKVDRPQSQFYLVPQPSWIG